MSTSSMWFTALAGVASMLGAALSLLAFIQARRANISAAAASRAVHVRNLAEEMHLACINAEEVVDYLVSGRLKEAAIRIGDLTSALSELPYRRSPYLTDRHKDGLLTAREQLASIVASICGSRQGEGFDSQQAVLVARRVAGRLREVLGTIRGTIESGA